MIELVSDRIRDFIVESYINGGRGVTIKEISEATGLKESKVRRVIDCGLDGVESEKETRDSYSKDYPGITTGVHFVKVYVPRKRYLANILRKLRKG